MERIKNLSLKKAFFGLSITCLLAALFLLAGVWGVCEAVSKTFPSKGLVIDFDGEIRVSEQLAEPTRQQERILGLLQGMEIFSCIFFPVMGLGIAGILFYRWKLKGPIRALREGTEQIRQHNLDFSILKMSEDELGEVCGAFELMREELLQTQRELWQQAEEQKRLNAAFAHDLRNPVTVLKGTVKLMGQGVWDAQTIERLESYVGRIERYVDAMSSIKSLEQMPVQAEEISVRALLRELEETALTLASLCVAEVFCPELESERVWVDHGIFLTVAENLIGNAARFAQGKVQVILSFDKDKVPGENVISLRVADDGPGFPESIIKEGPKPFGRQGDGAEHLGMGLYGSLILCRRHGGDLKLCNDLGGVVTAVFRQRFPEYALASSGISF